MSLLHGYDLLDKMKVITPAKASVEEIRSFHTKDYLDFCDQMSQCKDQEKFSSDLDCKLKEVKSSLEDEFGMEYDCPIVQNLKEMILWLAGGSLSAAKWLTGGYGTRAINWGGGWHHAQRDKASGFCYVNDIVIAIHELRKKFDKVLYIDLDVHHGDGVENAFAFTKKVFTFSIHKYSPGFYPGSGSFQDVGFGKAKYYCLNVPLKDGINDEQYNTIFTKLFEKLYCKFQPNAIVVQCGADCLTGDPLGGFNLTPNGMEKCINLVTRYAQKNPCLFLGGGGYNRTNAARYWTRITSSIISNSENSNEIVLSSDIPDNSFFSMYGPSFELGLDKSLRKSENTERGIESIIQLALGT